MDRPLTVILLFVAAFAMHTANTERDEADALREAMADCADVEHGGRGGG